MTTDTSTRKKGNSAKTLYPQVAIVGAGPAGLSAATVIAREIGPNVLVIERESQAGGIPRHADHPGYGMRDRKSFMSGPAYAKALRQEAIAAGVQILTNTQITDWEGERTLLATSRSGLLRIEADVVILATGARERPRSARMIWGDRPAGIYTTGQLQNAVHLYQQEIGKNAVVVGAELVSWSAVMTLKEAGCRTVGLISQYPKGEAYSIFTHPGSVYFHTKVITNSKVIAVHGRPRVEAVEIEDVRTGTRRNIPCDTVVFTGDWIADHELAVKAGLEMDNATSGPIVDSTLMTSRAGVFSVGNINHPVETADVVSQEGKYVGERVVEFLRRSQSAAREEIKCIQVVVESPLLWVTPQLKRLNGPRPPRDRLVTWTDKLILRPKVRAVQGGKVIGEVKTAWPASPGRAFRIPASILAKAEPGKGQITLQIK